MTNYHAEPQAKLLLGVLCSREENSFPAVNDFFETLGHSFEQVTCYPFRFSDYYESEFGDNLQRIWFSGDTLVNPAQLKDWKIQAMKIESAYETESGDRRYNLDPGYVTGAKFVLFSRKNHAHRIYLGDGVYAEVTLRYENGQWRTMPKSYPEFQSDTDRQWLDQIRQQWKNEVKNR